MTHRLTPRTVRRRVQRLIARIPAHSLPSFRTREGRRLLIADPVDCLLALVMLEDSLR